MERPAGNSGGLTRPKKMAVSCLVVSLRWYHSLSSLVQCFRDVRSFPRQGEPHVVTHGGLARELAYWLPTAT